MFQLQTAHPGPGRRFAKVVIEGDRCAHMDQTLASHSQQLPGHAEKRGDWQRRPRHQHIGSLEALTSSELQGVPGQNLGGR